MKENLTNYSSKNIGKQEIYTGIEIEPYSRKIWKIMFYISIGISVCAIFALYQFADDPGMKFPLFPVIISILTIFTSLLMTNGIKGYYVIETDKKQIAYYQEFYRKISVKSIAKLSEIKRVEIQMEEIYNTGGEDAPYYINTFYISLILNNDENIIISDKKIETTCITKLIKADNISRLTFEIDEITKSKIFNLKYQIREHLAMELEKNFNFTKEQVMEFLYSPPEELKKQGEKIANLIGCSFLPIGKTTLHASSQPSALSF